MWRAVNEGKEVLSLGLIKRIGTGVDTNIWYDNWLPREYKLRPICARTQNPPMLVSELIDGATKTWDRQVLKEHFIEQDIDVITDIPLSSRVRSDFWAWHCDKRGIFFSPICL